MFLLFIGIIVKCHLSRELDKNRQQARKMMIVKLDDYYNGDLSVNAQRERLFMKKSQSSDQKARKVSELKRKYKDLIQESEFNQKENDNSVPRDS